MWRAAVGAVVLIALARCGGAVGADGPGSADAQVDAGDAAHAQPDASAGTAGQSGTSGGAGGSSTGGAGGASGSAPEAGVDAEPECTPPDGATWACDPLAQCGCSNGQACDLTPTVDGIGGTLCRADGPGAARTHCEQDEECQAGLTCNWFGCRKICATSADCEGVDPYRHCELLDYYKTGTSAYGFCVELCDPADPHNDQGGFVACGPGFRCRAFDAPWVPQGAMAGKALTFCTNYEAEVGLDAGEACEFENDCQAGMTCVAGYGSDGDAGKLCRRWCHMSEGCGAKTCIPTGVYAGTVELGLCAL